MIQQGESEMDTNHPQYLTEVQVSHMTGIALSTLRNHRFERKGIPYIKFGRSVRYLLTDVTKTLEAGRIQILV